MSQNNVMLWLCFESGGWDATDRLLQITSDRSVARAFMRQNTKANPNRFFVETWMFDGKNGVRVEPEQQ